MAPDVGIGRPSFGSKIWATNWKHMINTVLNALSRRRQLPMDRFSAHPIHPGMRRIERRSSF
jgi:hypothetical protein